MEPFESTNPFAVQRFGERGGSRLRWGLVIAVAMDMALAVELAKQAGGL